MEKKETIEEEHVKKERVDTIELMEPVVCEIKPIPTLKPIGEALKAIAASGKARGVAPLDRLFISGILAGAFIAWGGFLSVMVGANNPGLSDFPGIKKLISGSVFPVGLILVIFIGTDLFTGNTFITIIALMKKTINILHFAKIWIVSYIGNVVGSIFIAFFFTYLVIPNNDANSVIVSSFVSIANGKMEKAWYILIFSSIACNILVCLAVYLSFRSKNMMAQIFCIWFPIMIFVALGYEHSIANWFFIPTGLFYGADNWYLIFYNISIVTVGNIIGGVGIGVIIFYQQKRQTDWKDVVSNIWNKYILKKEKETKNEEIELEEKKERNEKKVVIVEEK